MPGCGARAMGRRKNNDVVAGALGGNAPTCRKRHGMELKVAIGDYECDACKEDVKDGSSYYGCAPCDYSVCCGCYVKLAAGETQNVISKPAESMATMAVDRFEGSGLAGVVEPHIADLCEHFKIEDHVMMKLNRKMADRKSTFEDDVEKLWEELKGKRNPTAFLLSRLKQMDDGTFVGKGPPPQEVTRLVEKFRLDDDASNKLADYALKRPNTAEAELREIEKRLEGAGRPSAIVMTCVVKLFRGEDLPPLQRSAAPAHRDYAERSLGDVRREERRGDDRRDERRDGRREARSRSRNRSRSPRSRSRRR